jgi:hypothetical protein
MTLSNWIERRRPVGLVVRQEVKPLIQAVARRPFLLSIGAFRLTDADGLTLVHYVRHRTVRVG